MATKTEVERLARLLCEERGLDPDAMHHAQNNQWWLTGRARNLLNGKVRPNGPERRALARLAEGRDGDA